MIHVKVYGIPDNTSQEKLSGVEEALKLAIPFIKGVNLSYSQTLVFFPEDKLKERPEIKIIAEVGLSKKQSKLVRKELAKKIKDILFAKFENASQVTCFINEFDEKCGFASILRS